MMKKHLLFLLMALLCAIGAYAADGDTFSYKGLKYTVISETDKQVEVSGYEGEPINLTIPSTAQSTDGVYTVTKIGAEAFLNCGSLVSVFMANTIIEIDEEGFAWCECLENIELSSSLISIGTGSLAYCELLRSVRIPKLVEKIGDRCFKSTRLENIYVDSENSKFCDIDGIMYNKDKTELIVYPCARTEFTILDSVTKIGNSSCCSISVKDVVIPNSVHEIGDYAFYNSNDIETLCLPDNLFKIGVRSFESCNSLENVFIPTSIKELGLCALCSCHDLKNIIVAADNDVYCDIDGILYSKDKTKLITVPPKKEEFIFSTSISSIDQFAFVGSKIKYVEIPKGIKTIPRGCFIRSLLTSITLPKSITAIMEYGFQYCLNLNVIFSYSSLPPKIIGGYEVFHNVPTDAVIYVPKGSKAKYEAAEGWNYFHDFREMEGTGDDEPEVAAEPELAMIEYFIDKDPGVGNATKLNTSAEVNSISIPTAAVTPGAHLLSVRACDNEVHWSATVTNPLYVLEPISVKRAEYFVDHDPGEGRGTAVSVSPDGTASFVVPTAGLSKGIHELALRGLLPNGEWITLFENTFAVTEVNGVNDIAWSDDILISRNGGNVVISGEALAQGNCTVEIYDLSGIQLMSDSPAPAAELTYPIDRSRGPVVVRVQTPDKRCTKMVR